jgi:hypothetical protein
MGKIKRAHQKAIKKTFLGKKKILKGNQEKIVTI